MESVHVRESFQAEWDFGVLGKLLETEEFEAFGHVVKGGRRPSNSLGSMRMANVFACWAYPACQTTI